MTRRQSGRGSDGRPGRLRVRFAEAECSTVRRANHITELQNCSDKVVADFGLLSYGTHYQYQAISYNSSEKVSLQFMQANAGCTCQPSCVGDKPHSEINFEPNAYGRQHIITVNIKTTFIGAFQDIFLLRFGDQAQAQSSRSSSVKEIELVVNGQVMAPGRGTPYLRAGVKKVASVGSTGPGSSDGSDYQFEGEDVSTPGSVYTNWSGCRSSEPEGGEDWLMYNNTIINSHTHMQIDDAGLSHTTPGQTYVSSGPVMADGVISSRQSVADHSTSMSTGSARDGDNTSHAEQYESSRDA